jgi:cytochrome c biogenesis protein CcmG/thiol:disulfide interchange protein DsbE
MRRLIYLAPVLLLVLVLGAFAMGLGRDPSILPSTLIGKPLPAFDLPPATPAAPGLATAQFVGGGPKLLNVFGSWCGACRYEHPLLMDLKGQGVAIEGLDWRDTSADVGHFLQADGDPYQRIGEDPSGRTVVDLGVTGAPETFVVDGQGRVRYKVVGPITPQIWASTLAPLMAKLRQG